MVSGPLPAGQSKQLLTRTHAPATDNIQHSLGGGAECRSRVLTEAEKTIKVNIVNEP